MWNRLVLVASLGLLACPGPGPEEPLPLAFSAPALDAAIVGDPLAQQLDASGGTPPYHWSNSSALPPGVRLDAATGALSGTPTSTGTFRFSIVVADALGASIAQTLALEVAAPLALANASLPGGEISTPYAATFSVSGGFPPYGMAIGSGSLPPGIVLGTNGISGTPTTSGGFGFTLQVTDAKGHRLYRQFSLAVVAPRPTGTPLEVATWNLAWFGDTTPGYGPDDDATQQRNVARVFGEVQADLWGVEEVVSETAFDALVAGLPGYAGLLVTDPSVTGGTANYTAAEQKVALVYRTDRISVQSAQTVFASDYNCRNAFAGRPPMEVRLTVTLDGNETPLRVLVLHAKANTGTTSERAAAYDQRVAGSSCLKALLDQSPSDPFLVLGDYNDDVDVSTVSTSVSTTCVASGTYCDSPYKNFVDDSASWTFPTKALSDAGQRSTVGFSSTIDHQLASNEVAAAYVPDSVAVVRPDQFVDPVLDYKNTTSDHYPVIARYAF